MRSTIVGLLAALAAAVALTVPASASASTADGPGCYVGEPLVQCVQRHLDEYGPAVKGPCWAGEPLVDCVERKLRDLCLACDPEPIVDRVMDLIRDTCSQILSSCSV